MRHLFATLFGRRRDAANASLQAGLACIDSGDASGANAVASALRKAGRTAEAAFLAARVAENAGDEAARVRLLREAAIVDPDEPAYRIELALALGKSGNAREAVAVLAPILRTDHPASTDAVLLFRMAEWQHLADDIGGACTSLARALEIAPGLPNAAANLSELLNRSGQTERARFVLARAFPASGASALLIRRALTVPVVFESGAAVEAVRSAFRADLLELEASRGSRFARPETEIGRTPFFLAYQGFCDRDDLRRLATIIDRDYVRESPDLTAGRDSRERVRVGFVSAYFYRHSVGRAFLSLVQGLPRERFDVRLYAVADKVARPHDEFAAAFVRTADVFEELPADVAAAARRIGAAGLDMLVYPDLGMDPFTWFLAHWRLAPLQCVCAGHPSTTGIATIDCFLSDASAEPADAQMHYSERLMCLDDFFLPIHDRPTPLARPRAAGRRYVCAQTIVKLHPDFDATLRAILAADPRGEAIVFADADRSMTHTVHQRIARALGPSAQRLRLLPRQHYAAYLETVHDAAVMLDTPHFGGGNTTLEALSLRVPVVTIPGRYLRSRFAFARLTSLGLSDCIAGDPHDLAARAVAIACDPKLRAAVVARLDATVDAALDPARPARSFAAALDRLSRGPC